MKRHTIVTTAIAAAAVAGLGSAAPAIAGPAAPTAKARATTLFVEVPVSSTGNAGAASARLTVLKDAITKGALFAAGPKQDLSIVQSASKRYLGVVRLSESRGKLVAQAFRTDHDGGNRKQISSNDDAVIALVTPNEDHFVLGLGDIDASVENGTSTAVRSIVLTDASGGHDETIYRARNGKHITGLAVSSDSRYAFAAVGAAGDEQLVRISLTGGHHATKDYALRGLSGREIVRHLTAVEQTTNRVVRRHGRRHTVVSHTYKLAAIVGGSVSSSVVALLTPGKRLDTITGSGQVTAEFSADGAHIWTTAVKGNSTRIDDVSATGGHKATPVKGSQETFFPVPVR